jgi:hypothetical protein
MSMHNERGNYRFTRGSEFYASGVVADRGFEIIRATFEKSLPLDLGFETVKRYLDTQHRPLNAICGFELRAAAPYSSRPLFMEFNSRYVDWLRSHDLLVDGLVPTTRSNLAVADGSITQQHLYAFLYTAPSSDTGAAFATSATADLRRYPDGRVENIALGDISPSGLKAKMTFIMDSLSEKLRDLGTSWHSATEIRVYAVHPVGELITEVIVPMAGSGARNGVTWHYTRPPVQGLEIEIDVGRILKNLVIQV